MHLYVVKNDIFKSDVSRNLKAELEERLIGIVVLNVEVFDLHEDRLYISCEVDLEISQGRLAVDKGVVIHTEETRVVTRGARSDEVRVHCYLLRLRQVGKYIVLKSNLHFGVNTIKAIHLVSREVELIVGDLNLWNIQRSVAAKVDQCIHKPGPSP